MNEYVLAVDFGTAHTVAALRFPDGQIRPLLFDATPLLRSAVYAAPGGNLLVGRDAERGLRLDPASFEPYPKRRVDESAVLLGTEEFPVTELIAAVLRRVLDEAHRVSDATRIRTVLTHPARWGLPRRRVLLDAAASAGLAGVSLVPEPVAAAHHFAGTLGRRVRAGTALVVYDLGAGTFDVSVNMHHGDGRWEIIGHDGLDAVGGLDLDTAIVEHVGAVVGARNPPLWQRLRHPATADDRHQQRLLWEEARVTKEQLSRTSVATLRVPIDSTDVHQTREEFERLARPLLDQTVTLTASTLTRTGLAPVRLAGVLLVGGATRVPLVATLLHQRLGLPPTTVDQPELVVAIGGLHAPLETVDPGPPPATPVVPVSAAAAMPPAGPSTAKPAGRRHRRLIAWIALGVLASAATVVAVLTSLREPPPVVDLASLTERGRTNLAAFQEPELQAFAQPWLNDAQRCHANATDHWGGQTTEVVVCETGWSRLIFRAYPNEEERDKARAERRDTHPIEWTDSRIAPQGPGSGVAYGYVHDQYCVIYWDDEDTPVSGDLHDQQEPHSQARANQLRDWWRGYVG
jgi:hypothetical protein